MNLHGAYIVVCLHHEGDQINPAGKLLIGLPLAVTRIFDDLQTGALNLAKLTFMRMPQ